MTDIRNEDPLRALLQTGDPAGDGSEPSREELAAMRRSTLNAIPETRRTRWLPIAVATAALALAVVLVKPDRTDVGALPSTGGAAISETPEPEASVASDRRQQLQFSTANGTRIVWVLDPDLNL